MDTEKLKTLADSKFKHATFRKNLRERVEAQLAVTHNGGLFKATPVLISFLHSWDVDEIVVEDEYHNPILCNRVKLINDLKQAYQFALNAWHTEFISSKQIRNGANF